ncbi:MAG: hypothetical protein KIPDCIKN_04410 [Haliscomenobacter sp.]|jgi:hypothetical protein|nr:hypothetical protein [Haliscomenobacter sp.]
MKMIVLIFTFLTGNFVQAQSRDSILYIFSDQVERKIFSRIEKYPDDYSFIIWLSEPKKNLFSVDIMAYLTRDGFSIEWHNASNRYAVINQYRVPILLDFDFKFSTRDSQNISSFGKRDENIKRTLLMTHSRLIYFDENGKIVKHQGK